MPDRICTLDLNLEYNSAGGILTKYQNHEQDLNVNQANTYKNEYQYIDGTHQIALIEDAGAGTSETFEYDLNGNPIVHSTAQTDILMFWDEHDRMKGYYDDQMGTFQYYVYDDKGERTIKYNLANGPQLYQNGTPVEPDAIVDFHGYKIYPNPYVVVTSDGQYSKHYFEGSTRFASRIEDAGNIFQRKAAPAQEKENRTDPDVDADLKRYLEKAGLSDKVEKEFARAATSTGLYYLHTDHLGTATYVTDKEGGTTQFFLNLPFGETMAEQNLPGEYENQYKFNAKELDTETGLYYYGARYYNPRISVWYGVDPLAEKMPSWSPYNYTFNNPVRYTDPDGRKPTDIIIGSSITKNFIMNQAFNTFAKTKEGVKFLSDYAKKGQVIAGHTYTADGKYHKEGIDLTFNSKDLGSARRGETWHSEHGNRVSVDVTINNNPIVNSQDGQSYNTNDLYKSPSQGNIDTAVKGILSRTFTIFHETFIHATSFTADYLVDRKFDHSNIDTIIKQSYKGYEAHWDHIQIQAGSDSASQLFNTQGFNGLKSANSIWSSGNHYNDSALKKMMWKFDGSWKK